MLRAPHFEQKVSMRAALMPRPMTPRSLFARHSTTLSCTVAMSLCAVGLLEPLRDAQVARGTRL